MEHLNMKTPDGAQLNLDALYKICPSCFTETAAEDGTLKHVVDFKKLRALLGDDAEDDAPEAYDFTWVGKRAAQREAAAPINKTLRPCPEESVDWENTQNLYIEGDNLEVLKLLQNSYMGKVKMIYIDPPYNTGNDFIYKDSIRLGEEEYLDSISDEYSKKLLKNTYSNGAFHSDWCSMIYMRLMIARTLLAENGVIFLSIDENEQKNLSSICDEVFGESNKVGAIVWERAFSPKNDAKYFSDSHDYILVYAKNLTSFEIGKLPRTEEMNSRYKNPDNDPRGPWSSGDLTAKTYSESYDYPITTPSGKIIHPTNGRSWITSKENMDKWIAEGRIWFGVSGDNTPRYKRYLSEMTDGVVATTIWNYEDVGHNQEGRQELKKLFNNKGYFDGPKPIRLMNRIIQIANLDSDSIVLDFFSGSATTAHAVMKRNSDNNSNVNFVMVQMSEPIDEKSDAYKDGYKSICDIGKERIRRAGKLIKENNPDLDTGFRVFKCDSSNMKDVYFAPKDYSQDLLLNLEDNIKEDRTDLDLLFDCMLRWGVELSLPLSSKKVGACTIHNVNDGDLVACFDGKITDEVIDAIADLSPLRVVFRDSSFTEASQKMNLFEIFKQKCNWTDEEVKNNVKVI